MQTPAQRVQMSEGCKKLNQDLHGRELTDDLLQAILAGEYDQDIVIDASNGGVAEEGCDLRCD